MQKKISIFRKLNAPLGLEFILHQIAKIFTCIYYNIMSKEELILSFAIFAHGAENTMSPWSEDHPCGEFYKNNVRVFSRACVPGVNVVILRHDETIGAIQHAFKKEGETTDIISNFADVDRREYQQRVLRSLAQQKQIDPNRQPDENEKALVMHTIAGRCSDLSTFLFNKTFWFYHLDEDEVEEENKEMHKKLGIHVVDVRVKRTSAGGKITFEKLFRPEKGIDIRNNLAYREGVVSILNKIGKEAMVDRVFRILKFKEGEQRIKTIDLEILFSLYQELNVSYVNLMDFTCRECAVGRPPDKITNIIYQMEQTFSQKEGFGKRKRKKSGKKHKQKVKKLSRRLPNK